MILGLLARETLRDAAREGWLYVVPGTFLAVLALQGLARSLTVGGGAKVATDVGLAVVWLVACGVAIGLGTRAVRPGPRAVLVLVRAVPRHGWVLGRSLGLALTLGGVVLGLVLAATAASLLLGIAPVQGLSLFAWLLWWEAMVLAGCGALLSAWVRPVVAVLCTGALWVAGHLADEYLHLAREGGVPPALAEGIYTVVPDLDLFDVQQALVHGLEIPASQVALATSYGALWSLLLLLLTIWAVDRRDLP